MHPFRPLSQVTGADEVSATHEVLMAALSQLLDTSDGAEAATLLGRLTQGLPHHFAMEEEPDGVFNWVCMLAPELGDEIQALVDDHVALLEEAAELRPPLRADDSRDTVATLQLEVFAEHLREHERRESMALLRAQEAAEER